MRQPEERYYELAEKWLNGTITPEERKEFSDWYNAGQDAPLDIPAAFAANEEELRERILRSIHRKKDKRPYIIGLWKNPIYRIAAAASVVAIFLGSGIYYFTRTPTRGSSVVSPVAVNTPVIKPGGNKAVLTLGDGSNVVLDTAGRGTIASQLGSRVVKQEDGALAYEASSKEGSDAVVYNVLTVPRGGKYNIVLEDGTRVWLNSASSLRYPTAFRGGQRRVELSGEGYFEVAKKSAMPFIVSTGNGKEVEVLGTHFNIMAYADEPAEKTTLLEGAVRVHNDDRSVVLAPGQQSWSQRDRSSLRVIKDADIAEAMAWKNDLFRFEAADMRSIMRQLARWYDIDVAYEEEVPGHFSGTIPRSADLDKVFQMLQLTGSVHFTMRGRQVSVRR